MRVDDVGVARDARADELAELGQLGVGPLEVLGRTALADQPSELGVGSYQLCTDRTVELLVVDHRWLLDAHDPSETIVALPSVVPNYVRRDAGHLVLKPLPGELGV